MKNQPTSRQTSANGNATSAASIDATIRSKKLADEAGAGAKPGSYNSNCGASPRDNRSVSNGKSSESDHGGASSDNDREAIGNTNLMGTGTKRTKDIINSPTKDIINSPTKDIINSPTKDIINSPTKAVDSNPSKCIDMGYKKNIDSKLTKKVPAGSNYRAPYVEDCNDSEEN
ncbi:hypothetical protein EJ04DRAFT_570935 [Polyplosphaeria fusca]|uniref:Uncharacterized protein n=1 Tax=Polyplosphaeria fusca TaxID=682080 RepID=A0A9P4QKX7_9PLEO|nr:hypothetical protein EJ04DRAFT_570935 [Polyplosphaeria fusca]